MIHYFTTPLIFAVGIVAGILYQAWCYICLICVWAHEGLHLGFAWLLGVEANSLGFTASDTYEVRLSDDRGPIQSLFICLSPLLLTPVAVLCFYFLLRVFSLEVPSLAVSLVLVTLGYEISICSLPSHADCRGVTVTCSLNKPVRSSVALLLVAIPWLSSVSQRFNSSFYRITQLCWLAVLLFTAYLLQSPGGFLWRYVGFRISTFLVV